MAGCLAGDISVAKDVIVALAAAVTAIVAIVGLKKWQQELHGKANFEVARGLARATYKLRDDLTAARSRFVSGTEYPQDYDDKEKDPEAAAKAWAHVFTKRWAPVSKALIEFETQSLEAEALWGTGITTEVDRFRRCAHTVFVSYESILDDKRAGGDHFKHDANFGKLTRSQAFGSLDDKDNQLSVEILNSVSALEEKLKPHLARKR